MRIRNNAPEIYSDFQDQSLRPPSVEDGNIPAGTLQGKIFTSEITPTDDYSVSYDATVFSVSSTLRETGNLNVFTFVIKYVATLSASPATNPGLFGSNLIKNGDPFLVKSSANDWVRGYIGNVENISFIAVGPTYTYTYMLNCAVIQGDPLVLEAGDTFYWNRQLYQDPSTFNNAVPPINFSASYDRNTQDLYFYWDDVNQESRKYRIMARDTTAPSNYFIYEVPGIVQNPDVSIKAFVGAGVVTTLKIENPGTDAACEKTIEFIGSTSIGLTRLNDKGELIINEFTVYDATVGTNTIYVYSNKTVDYFSTGQGWPVPLGLSYIDKLPSLLGTSDFYVDSVTQVYPGNDRYLAINVKRADGFGSIVITPAWRSSILNTKIYTHDGVTGAGFPASGKIIPKLKKTSTRARFYADPNVWGTFAQGDTWAFSISAIYDEINKLYTEWSIEEYIKF
jgi:hypothetical protein